MLATDAGDARSWPSRRLVPPDSLPWAPSSPASRVHVPGTFTVRGCPAVTDGLDGELARLQDHRHRRDGPSCNAARHRWTCGLRSRTRPSGMSGWADNRSPHDPSMRTSARSVYGGRWSRSVTDSSPTQPFAVDGVAVFECCTASGSAGCAGRDSKPRIKSLTGPCSSRFAEGRCAGQVSGAYACGQEWTRANCN